MVAIQADGAVSTNAQQAAAQSSAIIVTVDGMSIWETILDIDLADADHYLKAALESMDLSSVQNEDIFSLEWSKNGEDTPQAIEDLRQLLRSSYAKAQEEGKKFIVVSHSWGTFLTYVALSYESTVENPIFIDLYITLGSPLGTYYAHDGLYPEEVIVNSYVNRWLFALDFDSCVNCYPRVTKSVNYWAWGDVISGPLA